MYSLAIALALLASTALSRSDLVIQTTEGPVQGISLASGVRQFLGIPFAATTGGANRWKDPKPPSPFPSGTTFQATAFGPSCFQNLNIPNELFLETVNQAGPLVQSENCLNLNIWTPPTSRPQKTAVMIWIYGGSLEFGSVRTMANASKYLNTVQSNISAYVGENFVKNNDDVTIVSFNYRFVKMLCWLLNTNA